MKQFFNGAMGLAALLLLAVGLNVWTERTGAQERQGGGAGSGGGATNGIQQFAGSGTNTYLTNATVVNSTLTGATASGTFSGDGTALNNVNATGLNNAPWSTLLYPDSGSGKRLAFRGWSAGGSDVTLSTNGTLTAPALAIPGAQPGQLLVANASGTYISTNLYTPVGYFTNGPVRIAAKGNSIMSGYGGANQPMTFYLTNYWTPSNWTLVTNAGYPGESMSAMVTAYPTEIRPLITAAPGTNTVIPFEGGINDFASGASAESVFGYFSNYARLVHADNAKILANTCTPDFNITFIQDAERVRYNNMLRDNPQMWDYLCDIDAEMPPPPNDLFYTDYVHYSDYGHSNWAYRVNLALLRGPHNVDQPRQTWGGPIIGGSALNPRNLVASLFLDAQYPGIIMQTRTSRAGSISDAAAILPLSSALNFYYHTSVGSFAAGDVGFQVTASGAFVPTGKVFGTLASNNALLLSSNVATGTYLFTNTLLGNCTVFLFGGTVTGVGINGSQVGSAAGTYSLPLQPGEWIGITNSGAPTLRFKPW